MQVQWIYNVNLPAPHHPCDTLRARENNPIMKFMLPAVPEVNNDLNPFRQLSPCLLTKPMKVYPVTIAVAGASALQELTDHLKLTTLSHVVSGPHPHGWIDLIHPISVEEGEKKGQWHMPPRHLKVGVATQCFYLQPISPNYQYKYASKIHQTLILKNENMGVGCVFSLLTFYITCLIWNVYSTHV